MSAAWRNVESATPCVRIPEFGVDLGRGIARGKKPGNFKTAEYRVFPAYFRIAKPEADDHMNHHCAGIARRHRRDA
jgi:hypothetical protein